MFDLHFLIIPVVSWIYSFWLPIWYLRFTASDYPFGILDLRLLITPLVYSDNPFGIYWLPLWYLLITSLVSSDYPFGILDLQVLIIPLVSSDYPFDILDLRILITPLVS
jgi:hypothetical protein